MKFFPICIYCTNYIGDMKCKAFPNGIPVSILNREVYHTKNIDGDNGIKFEAVPVIADENGEVDNIDMKKLFGLGFSTYW